MKMKPQEDVKYCHGPQAQNFWDFKGFQAFFKLNSVKTGNEIRPNQAKSKVRSSEIWAI